MSVQDAVVIMIVIFVYVSRLAFMIQRQALCPRIGDGIVVVVVYRSPSLWHPHGNISIS